MHHSLPSARPAAVLALALVAALAAPGAAHAATTDPAATTTSTGTSTPSTTTTTSPAPTASAPATAPAPSSTSPSTTTTVAPGTTTTAPTTPPTTTATKGAPKAPAATTAADPQVPFGSGVAVKGLLPGGTTQQAGYAGGFMVRTLAARGHHYNFPAPYDTSFDGGNTADAVLGLDGAGVGRTEAAATYAYLGQNVGGYIGTDYGSLYAGPAGKVLIAVVAQGGDPKAFGPSAKPVDLLAQLDTSLGAAEPGRYSDLPATGCGYDPCDFSNTIGQALDLIGVGRATGSVPQSAVTYLLAQQCADGGFRGDLGPAGGACSSDVDATAFAAQAVIGVNGPSDPAATRALAFLAAHQSPNGSLVNGQGQANANTAGVAAQAFAAGGRAVELARAQRFLASLQLDCGFATALRGGIAFTAADRTTLASKPTDTAAIDKMLRATPQATLGLAGGDLLSVTAAGATSAAPTATCASTPSGSTTSSSTSTTTPPAGAAGSTTAAPAPAAAPVASAAPTGDLAFTGANIAATAVLGLVLLLAGAGALVLARRKGAHA